MGNDYFGNGYGAGVMPQAQPRGGYGGGRMDFPNRFQRYDIIHVNGENGARSFQMAPNSEVLLLDDTAPLVWLAQTDGAGYLSVTPFSISPYQPAPPVDVHALEERLKKLEDMINGKSDS